MKPDQPCIRQLRIELLIRSDIEHFLKSAVQLAKLMDIELEAIFIQDQGILNAAALPLVQEVCLWTAEEQLTSTTLLSRSMRIQVQQSRTVLAQIAEREAVPYSFASSKQRPARGNVDASESSILWAGGRGLSSRPGTCPVCVLISRDNVSSSCLQQAADFSVKVARPLSIYVLEKNKVSSKRRAEIKEILEKYRLPEFDINAIDDLDTWLQCARDMACFVLFMPRQTYTKCRSTRALEHISFPVLLV